MRYQAASFCSLEKNKEHQKNEVNKYKELAECQYLYGQ